ncbi:hypothetical protein [Streptomyces sp. NBC_00842]|uniref:hypothetical protein n=1 Tax=Streptomyces sp. NBC_00842 TaxID=2975848 RepID=UPI002F90A7CF|nr:hypothetical protein OH821_44890 [Streptomyces sp. NBC_00842]
MTELPNVTVQATQYEVCLLPEGDINRHLFAITVEHRGDDQWAVTRFRECLSTDSQWSWEPSPSNREDDWLNAHRFDLDTALRLARDAAPHVVVNGYTATEAYRRTHPEEPPR